MRSSSPRELVTATSSALTTGTGSQHASGACLKSSMSRELLRLKPVTSPSSSMPMASFPPAALANATMCLAASFGLMRALLRSKYWFSLALAKVAGSFWPMGCCMVPPVRVKVHSTATSGHQSRRGPLRGPGLAVFLHPGCAGDRVMSPILAGPSKARRHTSHENDSWPSDRGSMAQAPFRRQAPLAPPPVAWRDMPCARRAPPANGRAPNMTLALSPPSERRKGRPSTRPERGTP